MLYPMQWPLSQMKEGCESPEAYLYALSECHQVVHTPYGVSQCLLDDNQATVSFWELYVTLLPLQRLDS